MTALAEEFKKWLMQKPVEPSVMAPVPSRARLAANTASDRESRAEILRVLGMLPVAGAGLFQAAGDLAGESEVTPLGVAKAAAGAIMPVRGGPTKMGMMGEASRVNPRKLESIQEALARGTKSAAEVYAKHNALPMLRPGQEGVHDAWTPIMRQQPELDPAFKRTFLQFRNDSDNPNDYIKTTYGGMFQAGELEAIRKHYPKILEKEVRVRANDPLGSGTSYPDQHTELDAFSIRPESGNSLQAIAAHEGTHDIQDLYGLAAGYNQKAVKGDLADQWVIAAHLADAYKDIDPSSADAKLLNAVLGKATLEIPPGLEAIPAPYKEASPEVQNVARALAWQRRLGNMEDPAYKLYKAYHGEQAAEGARMYSAGGTPAFTTPLSKHLLKPHALGDPDYAHRLQLLHAMKTAGIFDPSAQPYELPKAFQTIEMP